MAAKFDRSQFKGTSLKTIKDQNKEISSNNKNREYLSIKSGTNKFRLFPAHPDSDGDLNRYARKKIVSWLPFFKKDEDGELTSEKSNRPFLNARAHAGQEKDIVEEYISLATSIFQSDSELNTKEKGQKISKLSDFRTGIKHQGKFLAYAGRVEDNEITEKGLMEISYGIKKKLDEISLAESEENPTGADIISHPDEGFVITIKYDKNKPNTEKYSVQQGRKAYPISDKDLEWFMEEDSLTEILHEGVEYDKGTIKRAVESLKIYDKENKFGVVDTQEFKDIVSELEATLPDAKNFQDDEDDEDDAVAEKKTLGEMSRAELKQFILDEDLDIKVTRKHDVDDILDMIEDEIGLTSDDLPSAEPSDIDESDDDNESYDDEEDDEPFEDDESTEDDDDDEEEEETPAPSRRTRRRRA